MDLVKHFGGERVDLKEMERREIECVGKYNAQLMKRAEKPEDLIVPVLFNVQTRISNHIYAVPFEKDRYQTRQIDFDKTLYHVTGRDVISAYLFRGKYETMREQGSVAYVEGGENIFVPICDGKKCPPEILVERALGEIEEALMIDVETESGRILSRDVNQNMVQRIGFGLLSGFFERALKDFEDIELELKGDVMRGGRWQKKYIRRRRWQEIIQ